MKKTKPKPVQGHAIKVADGTVRKDLSRDIPQPEWKLLWARSAGRCQFNGCNRITYRAPVSNQLVITAEHAHIIAFSEDGPRGNATELSRPF